ncbi:RHS repeat-associated core domain-containing protein [Catenulispora rubra]|uniref:RHS repeat-associated core domain-containing protein n=1 Tax=Catenulispora rubra TaxID=280293 RepID=UPI00189238C8|nr:RHS repeat-associated core domain-containing protein [Catenulispora rubra]
MARPTGWDILGLDGDPTPGVAESVQALAKEFGDFAHDVESAYRSLKSFGSDTAALQWVGQTAEAFKSNYGPLPGRLQKLYTSYSEASDALSAYAPKLQAAQAKADSALRQAQDAQVDLQRATTNANAAADDLKTAQQNHAASLNPQAVTDAQTAHDTAQTNLNNAKSHMAALTTQAHQAYDDRIAAAKECAKAIGHAQSDGIHNKHWWEHIGADLAAWGGKIAEIAGEIAPVLDVIALATSWIPGVDVITAGLAEADNIVALVGSGMQIAGDAMQGHFKDALLSAGMMGATYLGGRALGSLGGKVLGKLGTEAEEGGTSALTGAEKDAESGIGNDVRTAEGNEGATCLTDPVDVVSGWMLTDETDLALPGILPVVLRRAYASGNDVGRLFGPGWASTLDQRISINSVGIHFAGDDAQRLDYLIPNSDEEVLPARGARWPLTWDRERDEIRITDPWTGRTRHFVHVHFSNEVGQIRDLTAITDRSGNRTSIERDEHGTPTNVVHPAYRIAVDTAVTGAGPRIASLRLLDGSEHGAVVKQFRYDERGRLTSVVNSSGIPYTYEHDDADRITAWVDRVGYRYEYEYDTLGRVIHTGGNDGSVSGTFQYDTDGRITTFTDSLGASTVYRYDDLGHICTLTDPLGNTSLTEHDVAGRLLSHINAMGATTRYGRDSQGDVIRVESPDGAVTELEYNAHHQITAAHLPGGDGWSRKYDQRGNLVSATDSTGAVLHQRYADNGALVETVDPVGSTMFYEADAAGLAIGATGPLGTGVSARRDAFGRIVWLRNAVGAVTECAWTIEGSPAWRRGPDGAQAEWLYDPEGQIVQSTDPTGGVTTFERGAFGRIVARTGPDGVRHEFGYDPELRLTDVTNTAGATWHYEYDAAGQLLRETDFIGRTLTYEHDAAGRLSARTTGLGQRITLDRDAAGRVTQRQTPDGTCLYSYDTLGRLVTASGPDATVEYTRDAAGRLLTETINGRSVTYAYDAAGHRIRRTTPSGAVSNWSYDAAGRPSELQTGSGRLTFGFDTVGREIERGLGDAWLTREFDDAGRLTAQQLLAANPARSAHDSHVDTELALVLSRGWSWLPDGSPSEIRDSLRGTRRFAVDEVGRVTSVSAESWTENYAYDAFGNVSTSAETEPAPGDDATSGTPLLAPSDRTLIRSSGRSSYEHDAAGRLVRTIRRTLDGRRKEWLYSWDSQDRLAQVRTPDGVTWRYGYDPLGRRITKTRLAADESAIEQVTFAWDGPRLAEQNAVAQDGAVTTLTWDYEPGTFRPAAQRSRSWATDAPQADIDEAFHAIVTDLVGTPTELVTPDGRIAWYTTSTLWGRTIGAATDPDVDCPLRFPGQYHDAETGLHYNVNRYYDPDTAAYLTPDPLGLAPAPNDHAYVPNPLILTDALGLACGGAAGNVVKTDDELLADAAALHDAGIRNIGDPPSIANKRADQGITVATAQLNGRLVYSVSNNATTPEMRALADSLGYERIHGADFITPGLESHAEQILFNAVEDGTLDGKGVIAASRPACGPERQDCAGRALNFPNIRLIDQARIPPWG